MTPAPVAIRRLSPREAADAVGALAAVLLDAVAGGASVSFMAPLSRERAEAFWRGVARRVKRGATALLAATLDGEMLGTVQLILDLPENQPHRAEIAKMLVHRRARRRGLGAALLAAAEAEAVRAGRTLLVLDTASAEAERLYARAGWSRAGRIPDYALLPEGGLCATTVFYKRLEGARD